MTAHRYLFTMFEGGGNVPVQLGLARQLIERGHEVLVLGCAPIEAEALTAGCGFRPFRHAPHHHMRSQTGDTVRDWEVKNPLTQFKRIAQGLFFGPARLYARDVLEAVEDFRPDVLAPDFLIFGAAIAAEKSGLPTAILMHTPYTLPAKGVPPPGIGLRPGRGPLGRLRDRALWGLTKRMFNKWGLGPVNAARTELGLLPLTHVFQQVERAERLLVLTSQAFDFPMSGLPEHVRFIGPLLDDPTWTEPWTSPWPADHPDPLVLVSLGSTFQDQGGAVGRIIQALSTLPVRGLVTLGAIAPESLPPAKNVVVVRSAPHSAVLPHVRAVVTHGGHGTLIKSLARGVPVLCMPLGRDQTDNATRAELAGAGVRLKPSASVEAIRRAVSRLLERPEMTEAARRLAREINRDVAERRGVTELEALAGGPAQPRKAARQAAERVAVGAAAV